MQRSHFLSAGLLALLFAGVSPAQDIALDEVVISEGEDEAVVENVPWSGSWWSFQAGKLAQGYDGLPDNFEYDAQSETFAPITTRSETELSPLRKYDLFIERREGTNPGSALLELQGDDARDFHHHVHGERKRRFDDEGVGYGWWGHCNGWAAAACMEREPVAPITAEGIRFEVGDLKGLLTESYWGVRSDFTGTRYNKPSEELKAKVERGAELLDELGGNEEPAIDDYIAWYEDIFSSPIDDAVKPNLVAENFRASLENVRDWAKRNWEDAYADVAPDVFHKLLVTQIKNKRSALVFDTSANEEVWNFPAYYYRTHLTKVEDTPEGGAKYEVETTVHYAHDGVSESIIGVNELDMDYTYTLTTDADGHPISGEWTGDSVDDHPDFAWLPTFNPDGEDRGENPNLLFGKLKQILQTDHAHGPRKLELEVVQSDGNVVRQTQRIDPEQTTTWSQAVAVDNPVSLRVFRADAAGIVKVRYALANVDEGWRFITAARGEAAELGVVESGDELAASYDLPAGKQLVLAYGYDGSDRLIGISELALDVGGTPAPAGGDDAHEENDDRASAVALQPGTHEGLECNDDDWFTVEVPAGARLRVAIAFSNDQGDLDLEVVGAGSSAGTGDQEVVEQSGLSAGSYAIHVYGYAGARASYRLEVEVEAANPTNPTNPPAPTPGDDAFEENDERASAALLTPGLHAIEVRDEDWFAVDLAAGERATFTLRFRHSDGDLDLAAVDSNGANLATSTSTSDAEEVSVVAAAAGRYSFRVYGYSGATNSGEVELTVEGGTTPPPAPADDALEANDTRDAASVINRGAIDALRIAGNDDWFAIDVAAGETITLRIDFSHSEGDLDMRLVDANGTRLDDSQGTDDREEIRYTASADERIYLRVYGYDGARAAYRLEAN